MKKQLILCPQCGKHKANTSSIYGVMPCDICQKKSFDVPDHTVEMVGADIRQQRRAYANDIVQPWRSGEPSREFIEARPNEAKKYYTKEEMKKAKYVWDDRYYKRKNKK